MPLDGRGCTRATLTGSACVYPTPAGAGNPLNPIRDGDRGLQLFPMNEEFPVSAGHKLALIKSLPFVHTALLLLFLDSVGGGAWPFLVGGAICLVNSDNERDSGMLTSYATPERSASNFLEGQVRSATRD